MEENKRYTIGKISDIMGVSVQTLRFYEKIGLFQPCYVNPETGYRYYEYSQMNKIDRIRYLQELGISLRSIKEIYDGGSVEDIKRVLKAQQGQLQQEIEESRRRLEGLNWYLDYFSFMEGKKRFRLVYTKHIEKRYAMVVDMGEVPFSVSNEHFYRLCNKAPYNQMECRRQYVSLLDDEKLRQGKTYTLQYGQYLREKPEELCEHLIELPAGEYLCFLAPIYWEDAWEPSIFEEFLEKDRSYIVVANEYEDNLNQFDRCMYEVQLLER